MKEISPLCLVRHLGLKSANYPPHQCNVFCLSERSSWAFIRATAPEEAPAEPQGCSWCPPSWRTSWSAQTGFVTWAEHHSAFLESFIQGQTSYKPSANRDSSCRDLDPNRCSFASKDSFALKTGNCTRGRESFSPVKQSWRSSCCSLRGKIFLDCVSRQSLLFCRPKAFFFSLLDAVIIFKAISKQCLFCALISPTQRIQRVQGYLRGRKRGSISDALCVFVFPCLWVG